DGAQPQGVDHDDDLADHDDDTDHHVDHLTGRPGELRLLHPHGQGPGRERPARRAPPAHDDHDHLRAERLTMRTLRPRPSPTAATIPPRRRTDARRSPRLSRWRWVALSAMVLALFMELVVDGFARHEIGRSATGPA